MNYFCEMGQKFSLKTVCLIGIQVLEGLEKLHHIGYVHNDLKLDNILVGDGNSEN